KTCVYTVVGKGRVRDSAGGVYFMSLGIAINNKLKILRETLKKFLGLIVFAKPQRKGRLDINTPS
ncbi:hypothetical protein, partial [Anabaena sp. PCC 7938]|uniref:hypothetical protein n=1 Tax=Anabaena sp. PCC 7938 TaxID=1296340 RepID=UPI00202DE078